MVAAKHHGEFNAVKTYDVESLDGWGVLQPKHFRH